MDLTKENIALTLKGIERSLDSSMRVREEWTEEADWVRATNEDLLIARLQGKKEILEELMKW